MPAVYTKSKELGFGAVRRLDLAWTTFIVFLESF